MLSERAGFVDAAKALTKGDGCTAAPDFWWRPCCDQHDLDYDEKLMTRAEADRKFYNCLRSTAKTPIGRYLFAPLYYAAVRVFGGSHWKV